jgi:hypothetical protein
MSATPGAIENRYARYAKKFVNDTGAPDTADATLAAALAGCARPPDPDEYPAIRGHIATYLDGKAAGLRDLRAALLERAESYSGDARKFSDMPSKPGVLTDSESKRYAIMYRTIAGELRKVAASL